MLLLTLGFLAEKIGLENAILLNIFEPIFDNLEFQDCKLNSRIRWED